MHPPAILASPVPPKADLSRFHAQTSLASFQREQHVYRSGCSDFKRPNFHRVTRKRASPPGFNSTRHACITADAATAARRRTRRSARHIEVGPRRMRTRRSWLRYRHQKPRPGIIYTRRQKLYGHRKWPRRVAEAGISFEDRPPTARRTFGPKLRFCHWDCRGAPVLRDCLNTACLSLETPFVCVFNIPRFLHLGYGLLLFIGFYICVLFSFTKVSFGWGRYLTHYNQVRSLRMLRCTPYMIRARL